MFPSMPRPVVFHSLSYYPASIEIAIEDNGNGFDVEKDLRKGMLIRVGLGYLGLRNASLPLVGFFHHVQKS